MRSWREWQPSLGGAFRSILVARMISAFCMHISDCDETFNYWEPVSMQILHTVLVISIIASSSITLVLVRDYKHGSTHQSMLFVPMATCGCILFLWLWYAPGTRYELNPNMAIRNLTLLLDTGFLYAESSVCLSEHCMWVLLLPVSKFPSQLTWSPNVYLSERY